MALRDRTEILSEVPIPAGDKRKVEQILNQQLRMIGTETHDRVVLSKGGDSIFLSSFKKFNTGIWLYDELINFTVKHDVIMPSITGAFFYSSYFITSLLDTNSGYLHSNVDTWSSRIPGGLFSLTELCVPINEENEHWFFLRVRMEDKTIMLWDSTGNDECHHTYLKAMLRYMCDESVSKQTDPPATYRDRAREWKATNESHSSPKQTNGCG